jgi:hypothetical protein
MKERVERAYNVSHGVLFSKDQGRNRHCTIQHRLAWLLSMCVSVTHRVNPAQRRWCLPAAIVRRKVRDSALRERIQGIFVQFLVLFPCGIWFAKLPRAVWIRPTPY